MCRSFSFLKSWFSPLDSAVVVAFNKLFRDKKIYRAQRLVNWCPQLQSVISDIEVDHEEVEGRTYLNMPNGRMYPLGVTSINL